MKESLEKMGRMVLEVTKGRKAIVGRLALKNQKGKWDQQGILEFQDRRVQSGCLDKRVIKEMLDLSEKFQLLSLPKYINQTLERILVETFPKSCDEINLRTSRSKQKIHPSGKDKPGVEVWCDFETDRGRWTTIQKRSSGPKEEFYRGWTAYEQGFGSPEENHWLGLKTIHALTKDRDQELRIDLWDFEGDHAHAKYSNFSISGASDFYRLLIGGFYGTDGDGMTNHNLNGMRFSTKDQDNDGSSSLHCAEDRKGDWWYKECTYANLNGFYYEVGETPIPEKSGITWYYWKNSYRSLRRVEMKIRRRQ